jgi:hypothetical protein
VTAAAGAGLVRLETSEPAPIEAEVGAEIALRVRVSCPAGRDRRGMAVVLIAPDGMRTTHALATHNGTVSETADIVFKTPVRVGEHLFRFVLPSHEIAGERHEEASLAVPVTARPQATSLAVWEVPSPVVAGERFTIKAGAKSSGGCILTGRRIEVCDDGGAVLGSGTLGAAPWPGTGALYWTELPIAAPPEPGLLTLSARFEAVGLEIPHNGTSSPFCVAVVERPKHRLTVKVFDNDTAAPVEGVEIRLGPYRATTGPLGLAEVPISGGRHVLNVWKAGFEAPATPLDIHADTNVQVGLVPIPEEDPDARWKM